MKAYNKIIKKKDNMNNLHRKVLTVSQFKADRTGLTYEEYECPICNGTGKEIEKNKDEVKYSDKCFNCDGEGIVYISNTN